MGVLPGPAVKARASLLLVIVLGCEGPERSAPSRPPTPPTPPPTPALASAETVPAPGAALRVTGEATAMGTHLVYAAYTNPKVDADAAQRAFEAATAEIVRVENLMTTWRDSELSRVNAAAGKAPVPVGDETRFVVREALQTSRISQGTFDITFETLHGLWKFDEDLEPLPPKPAALKKRMGAVGWRHVVVDDTKKTIFLDHPDTRIGLGGIAKGYAVDRAASVLRAAGLESFYVQAGGDLYAEGKKPDGQPWSAGIRDPRGSASQYFALLPLENHAFSTAGDYERSYVLNGKRYHHILDPRSGNPATACRSVTVWAKTALQADEIDDAVFILGPKEGLDLVESIDGIGAVIVDAKNEVWISKRLQGVVRVTGAPTDGI